MTLPEHVGIIIDGNRRWAQSRNKHPWDGHKVGGEALGRILEHADKKGIKNITIYIWSLKNNAGRSAEEKKQIFKLILKWIKDLLKESKKRKTRIRFLGRWEEATEIKKELEKTMEQTKNYTEKNLNFCFMYDGQAEIIDACNKAMKEGLEGITIETFKEHLYTKDLPPLDLIIRTGMEDGCRLSGFMLWDASYAELIFHNTLWPDYSKEQLNEDLEEFSKRNRRFGK
ncbi:MAG: di-trans,poly-cis-decaprenylcistransferase [Nanoarchaeota archaeon]|nr:di-trans,poly-cis-decaprenylcistransferase [Nanoarchaeota archaeon]